MPTTVFAVSKKINGDDDDNNTTANTAIKQQEKNQGQQKLFCETSNDH